MAKVLGREARLKSISESRHVVLVDASGALFLSLTMCKRVVSTKALTSPSPSP